MQRLLYQLLVFVLLGTRMLYGQEPFSLVNCPTTQTTYVRHYAVGEITPTLLEIVPPPTVTNVNWSMLHSTSSDAMSCVGFPSFFDDGETVEVADNLTATFRSGSDDRVIISSDGPLVEGEHHISILLEEGGISYVRTFLLVIRKPWELVFVLDRSGSMECDADENSVTQWPGCTTFNSSDDGRRWDKLAGAVDNFIAKIEDTHTTSLDRLSVVYFDGAIHEPTSPLVTDSAPFANLNAFRGTGATTAIRSEMDAMASGGTQLGRNGTSIGEGMYQAVNQRFGGASSVDRRQIVLLFTDGEQNTGRWISSMVNPGRRITESRTSTVVEINLDAPTISPIEIYTASMVVNSAPAAILEQIADDADGYFSVLPSEVEQFPTLISGRAFNRIFSDASPRYIGSASYDLDASSGTTRTDFVVNRNVNRLIFETYFNNPIARTVKTKVYHDGMDVSKQAEIHQTEYSTTYIFPLFARADLGSEGTWTMEVSPPPASRIPPGTHLKVFGTADDHAVSFKAGTAEERLVAGESFTPQLELLEDGAPVTNAEVTAIVTQPGADLGDLLARTPTPQLQVSHTESGSCADRKLSQLLQDNAEALDDVYDFNSRTIRLKHRGGGKYSAAFTGAEVTGTYNLRYEISYTSSRLGEVNRMVEQSRYVHFPVPKLNLTLAQNPSRETTFAAGTPQALLSRPSYRVNGQQRFIGPGFATAFGSDNPSVTVRASDNCDGSYSLTVSGDPNESFALYLLDRQVYSGKVRDFAPGDRRSATYVALRGGRTFPQGDFDDRFDSGIYGELGVGTRFGSLLGLELLAGYYGFDPEYSILGGTGYLNLYLGGGSATHLVLGGGGGYYLPEDQDGRLGASFRATLEREIGLLTLGVEGGYFRLTEPELDFATLGLSLKIGL